MPPGARVTVRLPDPLSYATALVSILGAGRVVIPLDPGAPAAELSRVLAAARPEAGRVRFRRGHATGQIIWAERSWLEPGYRACGHPGRRVPGIWVRGIYLCASGTAGAPKGILLREDQLGHCRRRCSGVRGGVRPPPSSRPTG